jgi:hypothetical protein
MMCGFCAFAVNEEIENINHSDGNRLKINETPKKLLKASEDNRNKNHAKRGK